MKIPNRHFKQETWIACKHMKKCSTLLIFRKIHIKTTMSGHYTPIWKAQRKSDTTKCWWGCGATATRTTVKNTERESHWKIDLLAPYKTETLTKWPSSSQPIWKDAKRCAWYKFLSLYLSHCIIIISVLVELALHIRGFYTMVSINQGWIIRELTVLHHFT